MSSTSAQTFTTKDCRCVSLRRAVPADHEAVATLLRGLELPTDGVAEWVDRFWVAEHQGQVVGVAGMERYGDSGLLRSVAVAHGWRSTGLGRTLVDRVLEEGRTAGDRHPERTATADQGNGGTESGRRPNGADQTMTVVELQTDVAENGIHHRQRQQQGNRQDLDRGRGGRSDRDRHVTLFLVVDRFSSVDSSV